jgi:uncharacterized protein with FMN-binding domain
VIAHTKKILLVAAVAILFALYAFQERPQSIAVDPKALAAIQSRTPILQIAAPTLIPSSTPIALVLTATPPNPPTFAETSRSVATEPPDTATAASTSEPPTMTPTELPGSAFIDGIYTGGQEDAHWGNVTVAVTISNGMLSDVQFLEYPNHRNRSVEINDYAIPELIQETIQAQSAEVDLVSGATDTSRAYLKSLETALQQAQP